MSNALGTHHYVYDHKGERIMKSSVQKSSVKVNDQNIDDVQYLDPYTLYINPYYVVTELQGGDKVSKHYYMNTQRVATDISINYQGPTPTAGPQQPNAPNPKKPSADTSSVNYNAAFADLQETLAQLGQPKLDLDHMGEQPTLEQYYPELIQMQSQNSTMAAMNSAQSVTRVLFWYHPDYLGNVDLVTERDGKTYEFFTYNPWGEEMHQYNANTFGFSSPYRFNSKEKDAETGLYYYGARYYQSKLSVWLSVDPLANQYPHLSPYVYVANNPINLVDPDGRYYITAGRAFHGRKVFKAHSTNPQWIQSASKLSAIPYIGLLFTGSLAAARDADPSYKTSKEDVVGIAFQAFGFGSLKLLSKLSKSSGGLKGLGKLLLSGNRDMASALITMLSDPNTAEVAVDQMALLNLEEQGIGKFYQDGEGKSMTDEFYFNEGYVDGVRSSVLEEYGNGLTTDEVDQKVSERLSQVIDAEKAKVTQELSKLDE